METNKLFYKTTVLLAIFVGMSLPHITTATTPAVSQIDPSSGPVGTVFTVISADEGDLDTTFWFSSGNHSTFINPTSIDTNTITFQVPEMVCPGTETESCSSNFSTSTPAGSYSVYMKSVVAATGIPKTTIFGTFTVTELPPVPPGFGTPHSEGTNVLGSDGTVYRIVGSGLAESRSPYTSAGAFLSYKFNSWATTVGANTADLILPITTYTPTGSTETTVAYIPPRSGALINDHGTVYLITGGGRAGFTTEAVFKGLGFSFSNVYPGDTSFIGLNYEPINSINLKHHDGVLINDNGTLYVMRNGFRVGFPSMQVLDSWGYWVTDAVPANSYDRAAQQSGVVQTRMVNQLNL